MKLFSSDWHLSHNNVINWSKRPFDSIEQMNDTIIQNMINATQGGDDFYFLGDLSWDQNVTKDFFARWPYNVNFHWILGNHEKKQWKKFESKCASISMLKEININKTMVVLCHYPMLTWNKSHYNSWMLYGHHHKNSHGREKIDKLATGKMLNVNVEFHHYNPWTEEELIQYMSKRPNNWDFIPKK